MIITGTDRWDDDCLAHRPDWLCVFIGINDCNRNLNGQDNGVVGPEGYRSIYRELIVRTLPIVPAEKSRVGASEVTRRRS